MEQKNNNHNNVNRKYIVIQPLLLAIMVVFGIVIGYKMNDKQDGVLLKQWAKNSDGEGMQFGRVEEVLNLIKMRYLGSTDLDILASEAIVAVVEQLDNNSYYFKPTNINDFMEQKNGVYTGIGIETIKIKDSMVITKVYKDSPAEKSGISVFDVVMSINDNIVSGRDAIDISQLSKLNTQNQINLTILKNGRNELVEIALEPQTIKFENVSYHSAINDSVFYIKLSKFGENSYEDFLKVLEIYGEKNYRHLLLDLRDNPGGLLNETSKILNQLINDKGQEMFTYRGKKGEKIAYKTTGKVFYPLGKIAVIINNGSASGAEIIAGALQDMDRAYVTGEPSYGKATIQEAFSLGTNGVLKLTTARFFLPSGRDINNYELQGLYVSDESEGAPAKVPKSFKYHRQLPQNMGIIPDDFDSNENNFTVNELFRFKAKEFLVEYLRSKNTGNIGIGFWVENSRMMSEAFENYLTNSGESENITSVPRRQADQLLLEELGKLFDFYSKDFSEMLIHDSFLKSGLSYLNSRLELDSYLMDLHR